MIGTEEQYDALIIGAGHNGLIAGAYLARAGRRVLILERRDLVGGACVTEEVWPGFQISTAAYLCSLLRPEIARDLELERRGFTIYGRETTGFAPFSDGEFLFLYPDAARTRESLTRFCAGSPEDVEAYFQFEADIARVAATLDPFLMQPACPASDIREAMARDGIESLYAPFFEGAVRALLDARFRNDRLKAVLATDGLIGTYGGPSTPGTAYVLLHHCLGTATGVPGAWGYVRGGMGRLTTALADAVRDYGGTIRTGAPVRQLLVTEQGRALRCTGAILESGETLRAAAVLSNADPYTTFVRMMPPEAQPLLEQTGAPWKRLVELGGASAKINLAVRELPHFVCLPEKEQHAARLGTVHLCPGLDYLERAWDEAKHGYPSTRPMIEMYLQTATDSSLAPPGKHVISLFVQYFPYHLAKGLDLETERARFADRVVAELARYAPNIPDSILDRQILTPRDLEARFGLTGGHIFHGDLLPPSLGDRRPAPGFAGSQTPLPGLFLCGSGAHPGGCVFGAPGYLAAQRLLNQPLAHSFFPPIA